MHFFLRILLELVSALFSFLVEWFLCYEQPLLYGGALSPVVTAFLYTVLLLVVWLLPIFYDACREKGGIAVIALNLLPTEIIFGGEFLYRLPLAGAAVLILWGVAAWLLWYECYKASDLIAGYVGQTAIQTKDVLARGRGGVIFIDEAYGLAYDANSPGDSFKKEAVEYLLTFAEENRRDTVIIPAGYEADMERFMKSNVGLFERFTKVRFPSFTDEECAHILMLQLQEKHIPVEEGCLDTARELLQGITQIPHFSNARTTRNIADQICCTHIERLLTAGADAPDIITREDLRSGIAQWYENR